MTLILDVCGALSAILLPDPAPPAPPLVRVVLDGEPMTWDDGRLYVFPVRVDEVPFETGTARRQEFDLSAVYVTDSGGEEPHQTRDAGLAATLDGVRGTMLAMVRTHQGDGPWGFLRGLTDTTSPRTLDNRSAAVRITGWRVIGGT